MINYYKKILLLCVLLLGCVLTSIGVEHFQGTDEPIQIPPAAIVQESKTQPVQVKQVSRKRQLVNINTATEAELDTLPGIGPAIAQRIIAFRNKQTFTKPEDIMLVKGIGKKKFAKLRERISVE